MDDQLVHPDDATLFDLLEGELDAAREQAVIAHVERCSACAAFMDAALAGTPETTTAVVAMPEAASQQLHLRMAEGWRERMAALAAHEARADAAVPSIPMPSGAPQPGTPTYRPLPTTVPSSRPRRGGWRRALVPSFAAAVLAVLAGTSIWIGDDAAAPDGGKAAEDAKALAEGEPTVVSGGDPTASGVAADTAVDPATGLPIDDAAGGVIDPTAAAPGSNEVSAGDPVGEDAGAGGDPGVDPGVSVAPPAEQIDGSTVPIAPQDGDSRAAEAPPVGYEQFDVGMLCIAVFDDARLVLPDGRIPQRVEGPGPFGMFLVCG